MRRLTIATGLSRKETRWKNESVTWRDLLEKLKTPIKTKETSKEYLSLPKTQKDEIKDVGGFVGGELANGKRNATSVRYRDLITLDADSIPKGFDLWFQYTLNFGAAACVYSTHSHAPNKPRLRLIIPLSRQVSADEYEAIARKIAFEVGINYFDDTTYQPYRLMYWPSCASDAEFIFEKQEGEFLDADAILATYADWTDVTCWPTSSRITDDVVRRSMEKAGDPLEKGGIVGAFCKAYTIHEAIETYLSDVYEPTIDSNRYTFKGGSTSSGLVVYDDKFAYSHHSTDPAGSKLSNAFDLVRIHKFGDLDDKAQPDTPINRMPSFIKMREWATTVEEVKVEIGKSRLEEVRELFEDAPEFELETDWLKELDVGSKGELLPTFRNIELIIEHDHNLKGLAVFNEFEHRLVLLKDAPWRKLNEGDTWRDSDDVGLESYIEKAYRISARGKIKDSIVGIQNRHRVHPVRDYLDNLPIWDGIERVETLFVDFLGAEDSEYMRAITRKALTAAFTRIYKPGVKFDYMVTLTGPQGIGKSTLISKLSSGWYSDSMITFNGKEAMEQLIGNWLIEVAELTATRRADVETIKQFISKTADEFRPAYGRHKVHFPRQCIFFGTTNDTEFLRDKTGNRRFWVVKTSEDAKLSVWEDLDVDQIWAEVKERFYKKEKLFLPGYLEEEAGRIQEEHLEESPKAGAVREFLDMLLPTNWDSMSIDERRKFIHNDEFGGRVKGVKERDRVCVAEVWVELFKKDLGNLGYVDSKEIGDIIRSTEGWKQVTTARFGSIYGTQRGFRRAVFMEILS